MNMRWILAGVAALGLGLAAIPFIPLGTSTPASSAPARPPPRAAKAKPASFKFQVKDVDGKTVNLADYKGKVVMMNFFATWCGPCKFETPMFVQLQEQYRSKGVAFLGVQIAIPDASNDPKGIIDLGQLMDESRRLRARGGVRKQIRVLLVVRRRRVNTQQIRLGESDAP